MHRTFFGVLFFFFCFCSSGVDGQRIGNFVLGLQHQVNSQTEFASTFTYNGGSHAVGAILGIAHTMNSDETLKLRVNDNAVLAGTYKRKLGPHAFIASTSINMKNGEFLNKDPQLLGFGFEFNF